MMMMRSTRSWCRYSLLVSCSILMSLSKLLYTNFLYVFVLASGFGSMFVSVYALLFPHIPTVHYTTLGNYRWNVIFAGGYGSFAGETVGSPMEFAGGK